jgi:hypothetical protein
MYKPEGYKPFSRSTYNKYKIYEELLIDNINIDNHSLINNPDEHGIDVLVLDEDNKILGGLEAESHGKYWIDKKFPFRTCHFLYRKKKYIAEGNFYIMMNRKATNGLMIPFVNLPRHKLKIMTNNSVRNEKFFDVPIKECIVGWKKINIELNHYFNLKRNT